MSLHLGCRVLAAAAGFSLLAVTFATAADAARSGYVTAYSQHGNGSLSAPTRHTSLGRQVRLPGGIWIYCAGNCREELRRQKLDYWETIEEEAPNPR